MTSQATCPNCGTALPAPAAPCPRCLLSLGASASAPSHSTPPAAAPPTIEELAPLFPGLELEAIVGRGGMGTVYKARQRDLDRHVALKILADSCTSDPAFAERFEREARVLARISHPNVVQIFDAGRSGNRYWLMMEFVDGLNLRRLIQEHETSPRESLAIVSQICDALQYAHDEGIVHRDIKPENILVDRGGKVKIADFGLAKLVERETGSITLTRSDQAMGTPAYMAPEQIRKPLAVDHRADIYSLGVVLYELLTGDLPMGNFPLPSDRIGIDVRLDEVVLKTLEREPERRYQNASQVKLDVEHASTTDASPARAAADAAFAAVAGGAAEARKIGRDARKHARDSHRQARAERKRERAERRAERPRRSGIWWVTGVLGCCGIVFLPLLLMLFWFAAPSPVETWSDFAPETAEIQYGTPVPVPVPVSPNPEAVRRQALQDAARKDRGRKESLASHGLIPSGLLGQLRGLGHDGPTPDLDVLRQWVAEISESYAAVESAHLLQVALRSNGGEFRVAAFPDELLELEAAFHLGLAKHLPGANLSALQSEALLLEAFPFGRYETSVVVERKGEDWTWTETQYDTEGNILWQNERSDRELPARIAHFLEHPGEAEKD